MEPHFQHIKAWKFWLSVVALIVEGCIGILSSFLLIITQTTVMDLLLNFTALGFVSHLDELVFFLSRMGILGRRFKRGELANFWILFCNLHSLFCFIFAFVAISGWNYLLHHLPGLQCPFEMEESPSLNRNHGCAVCRVVDNCIPVRCCLCMSLWCIRRWELP